MSASRAISRAWSPPLLPRDGPGPYRLLRALQDPLVRRLQAAVADPEAAQRARLAAILEGVEGTVQGRQLGLEGVRDLEGFRARVPIRGWDAVAPFVDRIAAGESRVLTREPVLQFVETSGTTGAAKRVPVTASWARGAAEAQRLWVLGLLREHEALAGGSSLALASPAIRTRTAGGIPVGANTGRLQRAQPWWVRVRYPVPTEVSDLPDPDLRLYATLRFALQADVRALVTANPTTLLLLARRLAGHADDLAVDLADGTLRCGPAVDLAPDLRRRLERRLRRAAPPTDWHPARIWRLSVVSCWTGGSAAWFLPLLPGALGAPVPVREVGITASEGWIGVSLGHAGGACLAWALGEFLEFVADDASVHGMWELEDGACYRVVLTGANGLLRHDLGDRVRVAGHLGACPLLTFVRRDGSVLNATGEKVAEEHAVRALSRAARALGLAPFPFTMRLGMAEIPAYEVAFDAEVDPGVLAGAVDAALSEANVEYAEKRASGRLAPCGARRLPPGTWARWRDRAVADGAPDGQVKEPILALDDAAWRRLLEAADPGGAGDVA